MDSPLFTTKDWLEASICLAKGLKLFCVKKNGSVFFTFGDRNKAESLTEAFMRGDLEINARQFADSQRRIKDLIHRQINA